jgi:hypothetical protein
MDIRKLHHLHHRFLFLKAWYFLVPAIIFALLAVHGLRSNYSTMVKLREAVYVTDQQNGDVETALNKLRTHVYGHMNTNLSSGSQAIKPPIQLKARYERLVAADKERIKGINAAVSAQGEKVCAERFPAGGFNAPRVACTQDYLAANATKERSIPDQLYKFDFISPRWSPDLAGISIVLSLIFFSLFVARVALERYMLSRLK